MLTATQVRALTLFTWHHTLERAGFSTQEARRILFLRWLFRGYNRRSYWM